MINCTDAICTAWCEEEIIYYEYLINYYFDALVIVRYCSMCFISISMKNVIN